ncbi:Adaptor protein complex AP-2 alpha subunit [Wallemia mellicola]|nr:Adaptor protein complex AP-2 alpha subunit [Wallemia mellicola]TIC07644.1 Adaptor protein complex AP-2 alpha subunit [Wallemia mellicola]TIC07702.1 Adaptor protein complex AP-2 alpha subunit [Wallemia mellicola]TIC48718.1 Adaptor protein complex AP-2 alpha subunit [Wallemia mellicola]
MRGLTQYIADLRACRIRELEEKRINRELAHIRQRFKEGDMTGYQKRKYVAKILFTYILGYKVDIGHMEAVNLISSTRYSEKQMGYLALTLLLHENSELTRLVINSIRKDLDDMNEVNNCLALHAIANIGGMEMAETLSEDVHRSLISPTSTSFVKKKAALTLLRLYRKYPDIVPVREWALRIVSVMDDENLGVSLAVTSLIMTLSQNDPDAFAICYPKAVDRLTKIIIEKKFTGDYLYYKVPSPWLQVKLLRLLQYYPPSEDPAIRLAINNVLNAILLNSQDIPKNVQHANAQNAVLFEAINLSIHLDTDSSIVNAASVLLGKFIMSKETNVRYLGLDTMAHLAACADSLEPIKRHQNTILMALKDKDISVRKRGLDLLFSMCDTINAKPITAELLAYLQNADYGLRGEMTLKIAILTEKFATDYKWYIDTILRLIQIAGEHVGNEVWYRVIQIVTNTESLQQYSAHTVFSFLRQPSCPENLVKVGAYILGEFGHLIADNPGCSPIEQFNIIHLKSNFCSASTRALLLTTYIKWVNLFPEIKDILVNVFDKYRYVLDSELQQRASEYYALATREDGDQLLQIVCDEMPPFPERESALLTSLDRKHGDTQDSRTWIIGGKDANRDRNVVRAKSLNKKAQGGILSRGSVLSPTFTGSTGAIEAQPTGQSGQNDQLLSPQGTQNDDFVAPLPEKTTSGISLSAAPIHIIKNDAIDSAYMHLLYNYEGVLYDSDFLKVVVRSEYQGPLGSATIDSSNDEALNITFPQIMSNSKIVGAALTAAQSVLAGAPPDLPLGSNLDECLRASSATVLTSGDQAYDSARETYNSRTTFSPQYVVQPNSVEDVQHSVRCATQYKSAITSKSGGHGYAGFAIGGEDGNVTIDMSNLKTLNVDENGLVRAGTGNHLGELYQGIYDQGGWSLPGGTCPQVGTGGHASFGGYGPLSRKLGFLLDTITEAEVVFANGTSAIVSEGQDAFFAVTGAAPSFAAVTQYTYQATPAPENTVTFKYGMYGRTLEESAQAFNGYQNFMNGDVPNDLYAIVTLGSDSFELAGNYFGSQEEFKAIVEPLLKAVGVRDTDQQDVSEDADFITALTKTTGDLSSTHVEPASFYSKSLMTNEPLNMDDVYSFFGYLKYDATNAQNNGYSWYIIVDPYNGAIHDISTDTRSFAHRNVLLDFQFFAFSGDDEKQLFDLVDGMVTSITTSPEAAYPNYVDARLQNWQNLYYGENYNRLQRIKEQVDPNNTFRFPQSIELP